MGWLITICTWQVGTNNMTVCCKKENPLDPWPNRRRHIHLTHYNCHKTVCVRTVMTILLQEGKSIMTHDLTEEGTFTWLIMIAITVSVGLLWPFCCKKENPLWPMIWQKTAHSLDPLWLPHDCYDCYECLLWERKSTMTPDLPHKGASIKTNYYLQQEGISIVTHYTSSISCYDLPSPDVILCGWLGSKHQLTT